MKKNRIELLNLMFALFALIVSIVSIWFSYYTYKDTKTEKVNISVGSVQSNFQTKLFAVGDNVVIPSYWEITISNNSDKTISITDVNVENIDNGAGVIGYSHIYGGLYENTENFEEKNIDLPININSGESKKAFISIGILCDSVASKILNKDNELNSDSYKDGKWIRFNQAKILLAENNIDFYDNKASIVSEGEKINLYQSEAKKQQTFKISITTGKNTVVSKNATLYMGQSVAK